MAETGGNYRGKGPRGSVGSPERTRDDICDRLTDNPLVDASDIEVRVAGSEVTFAGSVDSDAASRQAEEIAAEAAGITRVRNELRVDGSAGADEPTPGDQVNRALRNPVKG